MKEEEAGAGGGEECGNVCRGGWVGVDVFEVPVCGSIYDQFDIRERERG